MKQLLFVFILLNSITFSAYAGVLTGAVVNSDGEAMEGVLVRLTETQRGMSESVYTNS